MDNQNPLQRRMQGIGSGEKHNLMQQLYPFCRLVFASWDFHITNPEAARLARRALRSQLKEMVSDASLQEIFVPESAKLMAKLRKVSCPTATTTVKAGEHGQTCSSHLQWRIPSLCFTSTSAETSLLTDQSSSYDVDPKP